MPGAFLEERAQVEEDREPAGEAERLIGRPARAGKGDIAALAGSGFHENLDIPVYVQIDNVRGCQLNIDQRWPTLITGDVGARQSAGQIAELGNCVGLDQQVRQARQGHQCAAQIRVLIAEMVVTDVEEPEIVQPGKVGQIADLVAADAERIEIRRQSGQRCEFILIDIQAAQVEVGGQVGDRWQAVFREEQELDLGQPHQRTGIGQLVEAELDEAQVRPQHRQRRQLVAVEVDELEIDQAIRRAGVADAVAVEEYATQLGEPADRRHIGDSIRAEIDKLQARQTGQRRQVADQVVGGKDSSQFGIVSDRQEIADQIPAEIQPLDGATDAAEITDLIVVDVEGYQ